MMAQFIAMIRAQVDKAIYVWGGQGEVATEDKIRRMETSTTNANRAIKLLNARKAQGIEPLMFDCSGLAIWAFQALGLISYDTTAEGLRRLCEPTKTPRVGDLAFSAFDSRGQAQHMGIVTKPDTVTEARGRDYGVVDSPIGSWRVFGRNTFIKEEVDMVFCSQGQGSIANPDPDVTQMQAAFVRLGIEMRNPVTNRVFVVPDGSYGPATAQGVRNFERRFGMTASDGTQFTDMHVRIMLQQLNALATGISQSRLDEAVAAATAARTQAEALLVRINSAKKALG